MDVPLDLHIAISIIFLTYNQFYLHHLYIIILGLTNLKYTFRSGNALQIVQFETKFLDWSIEYALPNQGVYTELSNPICIFNLIMHTILVNLLCKI